MYPLNEEGLVASREKLASELNQIRIALGRVAAFEGMDASPTAMMVDELVRDHEELEARIDAALMLVKQVKDGIVYPDTQLGWESCLDELARFLKGGTRVPNTPEDLEGNR
jgi:hypothetical protein